VARRRIFRISDALTAAPQSNKCGGNFARPPELAILGVAPQDRELDPRKPEKNARTPVTSP
jgi:hypothetical protein